MRKIFGIGETVLDIIFKDDKPIEAVPGGSTFNAMISLGRTAGNRFPILMVTETGDDHVGDIITGFMSANNVGTAAVTRRAGSQTHVSLAFLDSRNDAHYEFYKDHANARLQADKLRNLHFGKDDIVLFGSFFAINPAIRPFVGGLLKKAREAGAIIYYDINFRANHMGDLPQTIGFIEENCRMSDFVRGSSEDFQYLFGESDPVRVYQEKMAPLCPNMIYTHGAEPTEIFTPGRRLRYQVGHIETVSTIGAGDNFNAGFLYGILTEGLTRENLLSLPDSSTIDRLVECAHSFSAEVCRSVYNYVSPDFALRHGQ